MSHRSWPALTALGSSISLSAAACPYCVQRGQGHGALYVLALLVAFPYGVTLAVLRAIRRIETQSLREREVDPVPEN